MTASLFVLKLKYLCPSKDELIQRGYSTEFIEIALMCYIAQEKNKSSIPDDDEVIKLVKDYNPSTLDILDLSFFEEATEYPDYFVFGTFSGYDLILNKLNGEINWYDPFGGRIVMQCARDGALFLDALYYAMEVFTYRLLNNIDVTEGNYPGEGKHAYICALKAGSEKYEDFYNAIF